MSEITRTQKLGVAQWHATFSATICPESCLHSQKRWLNPPFNFGPLHVRSSEPIPSESVGGVQSLSYTLPCTVVASFGLRNGDT